MTKTKLSKMNIVDNTNQLSNDEKKKAAYVLNLCTVSVSQIIDYDDINILEQEYEAILNNINLETMPKDEPLLNIFKQLLDTITFFRIQEGDKEIIEKEYQQNVKNAIWNAVPNFGLIVAGGNPITMAISLASQVGIGYMNYRRNKARYNWNKEKELWQLQRSALEQFNGLRRELFDTAWRLSSVYNFPDEYRLTERQIAQYNKILMDPDSLRQYERLDSIKVKFEAYPPFWYFIGHAANDVACDKDNNMTHEEVEKYREIALYNFKKFEKLTEFNILREDQLAASCMLEHVDILLLKENYDVNEVKNLIDTAVKISGNKFDILELCAIAYLKIVNKDNDASACAESILRILVNEDYNKIINAQLLSGIYVKTRNEIDYKTLGTRLDSRYLYPMPEQDQDIISVGNIYLTRQKSILKEKYKNVVEQVIQRYTVQWNKLIKLYDDKYEYPDIFFYDDQLDSEINKEFYSNDLKKDYVERLATQNYELSILRILNNFCNMLFSIRLYDVDCTRDSFVETIEKQIKERKEKLNTIQNMIKECYTEGEEISNPVYQAITSIKFKNFIDPAFETYEKEWIHGIIDDMNIQSIMELDSKLREFCLRNNFKEPEIYVKEASELMKNGTNTLEYFKPELLGDELERDQKKQEQLKVMRETVSTYLKNNSNLVKGDNVTIYPYEHQGFETYLKTLQIEKDLAAYSLFILKGEGKDSGDDLLISTGWVVKIRNKKRDFCCPWQELKLSNDNNSIILREGKFGRSFEITYDNKSVDKILLMNLIKSLGNNVINDLQQKERDKRSTEVKILDSLSTVGDFGNPILGIIVKKGIEMYFN